MVWVVLQFLSRHGWGGTFAEQISPRVYNLKTLRQEKSGSKKRCFWWTVLLSCQKEGVWRKRQKCRICILTSKTRALLLKSRETTKMMKMAGVPRANPGHLLIQKTAPLSPCGAFCAGTENRPTLPAKIASFFDKKSIIFGLQELNLHQLWYKYWCKFSGFCTCFCARSDADSKQLLHQNGANISAISQFRITGKFNMQAHLPNNIV